MELRCCPKQSVIDVNEYETNLIKIEGEKKYFRKPSYDVCQTVHGQNFEADPDTRVRDKVTLLVRQEEEGSQLASAVDEGNFLVTKIADSASEFSRKSREFVTERLRREKRRSAFEFC